VDTGHVEPPPDTAPHHLLLEAAGSLSPVILRAAVILVALAVIAACGNSSQASQGTDLSNVALQTKDLPAGMVRCDLSGDIASFLDKEKSADPATFARVKSDWDSARTNGATAAYAALYTDTGGHCADFLSGSANPGAAPYKVAVNFVVQFKDESSAASGYSTGSFFHYSVADLKSGGAPVVEGTATGLTANAIVRNANLVSQTVFVALWQKKTFLVILAILNVDATSTQKAAVSESSRIK